MKKEKEGGVEEALRRIRLGLPGVLSDKYVPLKMVSRLAGDRELKKSFEELRACLDKSMESLVDKKFEELAEGINMYREARGASQRGLAAADACLGTATAMEGVIGSCGSEDEATLLAKRNERDEKAVQKLIKKNMGRPELTLREIRDGRLEYLSKHLRYVKQAGIREDVKKRAEDSIHAVKRCIDGWIREYVAGEREILQMEVGVYKKLGGSVGNSILESLGTVIRKMISAEVMKFQETKSKHPGIDPDGYVVGKLMETVIKNMEGIIERIFSISEKELAIERSSKAGPRYEDVMDTSLVVSSAAEEMAMNEIELDGSGAATDFADISVPRDETGGPSGECVVMKANEFMIEFFSAYLGAREEKASEDESVEFDVRSEVPDGDIAQTYEDMFVRKYGIKSRTEMEMSYEARGSAAHDTERLGYAMLSRPMHDMSMDVHRFIVEYSCMVRRVGEKHGARGIGEAMGKQIEKVTSEGISEFFKKREQAVMEMISELDRGMHCDGISRSLKRYNEQLGEVLDRMIDLDRTVKSRLGPEYIPVVERVFKRLQQSVSGALAYLFDYEKGLGKQMNYSDFLETNEKRGGFEALVPELERWNPYGKSGASQGENVYVEDSSEHGHGVSEFLILVEDAKELLEEIANSSKGLVVPKELLDIADKLGRYAKHAWNCAVHQLLFFVKECLDGAVSGRRSATSSLMRLLSPENFSVVNSIWILKIYTSTYFVVNSQGIFSRLSGDRAAALVHLVHTLEGKMVSLMESLYGSGDLTFTMRYSVELFLEIRGAVEAGDEFYLEILKRQYSDDKVISRVLGALQAKPPRDKER